MSLSDRLKKQRQNVVEIPARGDDLIPEPEQRIAVVPKQKDNEVTIEQIRREIEAAPKIADRTTFSLEEETLLKVEAVCRKNGITKDVLVEAMFAAIEDSPTMNGVINDAKARKVRRNRIGQLRKALSVLQG